MTTADPQLLPITPVQQNILRALFRIWQDRTPDEVIDDAYDLLLNDPQLLTDGTEQHLLWALRDALGVAYATPTDLDAIWDKAASWVELQSLIEVCGPENA